MRVPTFQSGPSALGILAALALGFAAAVALLYPTARNAEPAAPPPALPRATAVSSAVPTTVPTVLPTPVPSPSAAATPVTLNVASVQSEPAQGGVIVTIGIANNLPTPLSFNFDPTTQVHLTDAHGQTWTLRWAEYRGAFQLPANSQGQLVRAFFGESSTKVTWPLTVSVSRIPHLGAIAWTVDDSGATGSAQIQPPPPVPNLGSGGPVSLSVANAEPDTQLGGVQVDLMLHNGQAADLALRFDPNRQLTAVDNLGRPWSVRWAQYDGQLKVGSDQTVRLAQVFFAGPIDSGNPGWLRVSLNQIPGSQPVQVAVPLQ